MRIPIFDLDGTLIDSDRALADAFVALGVERSQVTYGHVLADECERVGVTVEAYLAVYDSSVAQPFRGVEEVLAGLERWAVCSNKQPVSGRAELERLGWTPDVAHFADSFGGPKHLGPSLEGLGLAPHEVVYVGDTDHDRTCAHDAGVPFVLAGWNPRTEAQPGDVVLEVPGALVEVLAS